MVHDWVIGLIFCSSATEQILWLANTLQLNANTQTHTVCVCVCYLCTHVVGVGGPLLACVNIIFRPDSTPRGVCLHYIYDYIIISLCVLFGICVAEVYYMYGFSVYQPPLYWLQGVYMNLLVKRVQQYYKRTRYGKQHTTHTRRVRIDTPVFCLNKYFSSVSSA